MNCEQESATRPRESREYADHEFGLFLSDITVGVNQVGEEVAEALASENRKEKLREVLEKLAGICTRMRTKLSLYDPDDFRDEDMPRLIDLCRYCSSDGLRTEDRLVCIYNCLVLSEKGMKPVFRDYNEAQQGISYATDIQNAISCSNDPNELLFHWKQWREKLDDEERKLFLEVVDTIRSLAERRNESTAVFYYLAAGHDKFYHQILNLYEDILPLYKQLHAYIRHQLRQKYGNVIPKNGPIPQHFMDQVFAQTNRDREEFISYPFPGEKNSNFTEREVELGFTGLKQVETANEFFDSIGMPLPENFCAKYVSPSLIESSKIGKPSENFKYEFNPKVGFETFLNGFGDLLNLRYKMEFSKFSYPWDREPCPGFSDALVKAVKLSVLTPSYLKSINFLEKDIVTKEYEINRLYRLALEAVLALPVHILNDKFWIELSSGEIEKDKLDAVYEKMLLEMAGISIPHHDENYKLTLPYQFLKGASYTRPNTVNIFSEVMGYEIYQGLCKKAALYDPEKSSSYLKDCNFYSHKEAGKCLSTIMSYGSRKHWSVILEPLTGKNKLSVTGILEYFKPLEEWLVGENKKNEEPIGW